MIDLTKLVDDWAILLDAKPDFVYAEDEINMEEYLELVKQTYDAISDVYKEISDEKNLSPDDLMGYFNLLEEISMYAAPCYTDESINHSFGVSRIIAEELAAIAANFLYAKEDKEEPFKDGVLASFTGFECEIERVLYYDVNKKDLSDFQELADKIGY